VKIFAKASITMCPVLHPIIIMGITLMEKPLLLMVIPEALRVTKDLMTQNHLKEEDLEETGEEESLK
jgi:hypothetical protein